MDKPPSEPRARGATIRTLIKETLETAPADTGELSSLVGIPEKQVAAHLEHLVKSLKASNARLRIEPSRCLACEFVFRERTKLTTPSACPRCRSERIAPPRFRIES
jgi:predicted Zn-ribbon and HTH transcriptional regulator